MTIETSIYIHINILEKINNAAKLKGISRTELIILLIKQVMDETPSKACLGKRIQYQERCPANEWHTLHLELRPDDYNFFLDLRKFLKMSVSYILKYAVNKYLTYILKISVTDNYKNKYKGYILSCEIIEGIICWKQYWGFTTALLNTIFRSRH